MPGIREPRHLVQAHYNAPTVSNTRLMLASSRNGPQRSSYVTLRTVNDVHGVQMRRDWRDINEKTATHLRRQSQGVRREISQQNHNRIAKMCDAIYL